jgi:hypothetical protein
VAGLAACGSNPNNNGGGDDGGGSGSNPDGGGSGSDGGGGGSDGGVDNTLPTYPTQHPRIYISANKARLEAALSANRPAATRFKGIVDNWVNGTDYWGFEIWNAALMGQLTSDPKYCGKAISEVDAQVSAAESAIASGAQPVVAGDSYLDVGHMIGDVVLTYDWCYDRVTASQRTRWLAYANQAVWNVWNHASAKWGSRTFPWTGWAVDDPSDNYYYQFLRATMLLGLAEKGEDPAGDQWITQFRDTKMLGQLVPTFEADLKGGGSREGTGYGVAMRDLFGLYDIWHATTGENLASKTHHTRASMMSFMHQVVPTLDRFAPTGDQSRDSTASLFDYQRSYLQTLVRLYPTDALAHRAQAMLAQCSVPTMANSFMAVDDFLYDNMDVAVGTMNGDTAYYAPGIGELYVRSAWGDNHATWINMIAGPYTQSHAHQDQGSLMIYKDGWLSYDSVVDSHSGLRQETGAHSLVRITSGGASVPQIAETQSQLMALHTGTGWTYAAADLTAAYNHNPAVSRVQREIVYLQPDTIIVYDRVTTASGTQQVWQLATPKRPTISGSTATITGTHALHVQRFAPTATASVYDYTQDASGDYAAGFRLDETVAGGDQRFLHVLSIDGAVTGANASGDSTVTVTLSNGKTATVAFNRAAIGATLTYGGATTTLAAGLDTLPE